MTNDIAIYNAYVDDPQNGHCELAKYLGVNWKNGNYTPLCKGFLLPAEAGAHHILSQGMRPHLRSNLIRITSEAHRLVHNGVKQEPQLIRVACILAKLVKRADIGDPAEFDLDAMYDRFGMHMAGVVSRYEFLHTWQKDLQARCLWLIETLTREGLPRLYGTH